MHVYTAFRIHVSPVCKEILDELCGYRFEYRGETELKVSIVCSLHVNVCI